MSYNDNSEDECTVLCLMLNKCCIDLLCNGIKQCCCCNGINEERDYNRPLLQNQVHCEQPRPGKQNIRSTLFRVSNFKADNDEKKKKVTQLRHRRDQLKQQYSRSFIKPNTDNLSRQRDELIRKGYQLKDMKMSFGIAIEHVMRILDVECASYVQLPKETGLKRPFVPARGQQKEIYRPYGLLLSSCLSSTIPSAITEETAVITLTKIQSKDEYKFIKGVEDVNDFVKASIQLTYSMLTLLPPLLVIQPSGYKDDVQDTNRLTWDETSDQPLIYYRPVVVYGNQLHIAVKGLVGNVITGVSDN